MHDELAMGLWLIIPTIIALVQEGKDKAVTSLCCLLLVCGAVLVLYPYVGAVQQILPRGQLSWTVFAIVLAVTALVAVVKLNNRVVGTLIATAGVWFALGAVGIVY